MDFAAMRRRMVDNQISTNRVDDKPLLEAMAAIPREAFVPKPLQGVAYVDDDIAVAEGRFLLQPLVTARLIQAVAVKENGIALDVGCATGYTAALLARMASTVVALEADGALIETANRILQQLGIDNVAIVQGPLEEGAARQGPFDAIVVEGAANIAPAALLDQLAEGGRLACVIQEDHLSSGRVTLFEKRKGVVSRRELADAHAPFLPGFSRGPAFAL